PAEAVSWGKIDPDELPSTIVCYTDSTIALPLVTAYVLNQCERRPLKRLYDRRGELLDTLQKDYLAAKDNPVVKEGEEEVATYPCGTRVKR
ncbi:MAG: deoxyhypusine synthase family protein, partial [Sphaerospermopsis kisseleviana]